MVYLLHDTLQCNLKGGGDWGVIYALLEAPIAHLFLILCVLLFM